MALSFGMSRGMWFTGALSTELLSDGFGVDEVLSVGSATFG